ncbi:MAG: LysM peptidoglycan-binding domain-containing protein [Chloroflexota bacterium]|nr:LysM peptidoglycan-binding domain-containing protein [Chloroflexota bacterium]
MKRLAVALIVVMLLAMLPGGSAMAYSGHGTRHVVQPGESVYSIARQYCTSWQEVYYKNRQIIGPYPEVLKSGTVLHVVNRCGGTSPPPGSGGVYDRGPSHHAQGTVVGNTYFVAPGDTMFSIANRFGLTVGQMASANGIANPYLIYAGQRLVIPGFGYPTPYPTVYPTPYPTPHPTPQAAFITILHPVPGATLPATFTVSGEGAGLYEGNVVVEAWTNTGQLLMQQATTLQGSNVGTGGRGTYSINLTVSVANATAGYIQASSPGSPVAPARVSVTYGGSQPTQAFVTISSPGPGSVLPATFTVSGEGGGLVEGNVVVEAWTNYGQLLLRKATTLQGSSVGTGGRGVYSVSLTVNAAPGTPGTIRSYSPETTASTTVGVTYGGQPPGPTYKDFHPGECRISGQPGAPLYAYPDGPVTGSFGSNALFDAFRGARINGVYWYMFNPEASMGNPPSWAPQSSLAGTQGNCTW